MEIGRRAVEEGRERTPSPISSCAMQSSMHEPSSASKLKVVLPSAPGGNGVTSTGGPPTTTHTHNRTIPTLSLAPGVTSIGIGLPSNGLSLGVSPSRSSAYAADDLKLPASMDLKQRKPVKYRECLKNHAANLGGHATDGCGEFMPSGEEGTLEALTCAACNCHRNFHRREVEGEPPMCADCRFHGLSERKRLDALFPSPLPLASPALLSPPPHMIMAFNPNAGVHDSDEYDGGLISPHSSSLKKRFRTKFTPEQKEQMASFAQKLGWRIQKQDEEAVQQFCAEVGVKRHVLKVWMHNNKLTMGKKVTCCLTMTPENPDA
ncbi:hypothetical protein L7F22_036431 [Adiantum nelumboides]|nr:hypothetical protein [Adiantum nelumboides]